MIDAVSSRYLARAINKAADDGAALVVVQLDTPGGRIDSMRDMVEAILGSRAPLAVYVSPARRAGGVGRNLRHGSRQFRGHGARHQHRRRIAVSGSGEDLPSTLRQKVDEDTRAFIRGIAEQRNRNADALEDTVTYARAYSASEAVDLGIVDLIATDMGDLLNQLDGRTAETANGTVVVSTAGAQVARSERRCWNASWG